MFVDIYIFLQELLSDPSIAAPLKEKDIFIFGENLLLSLLETVAWAILSSLKLEMGPALILKISNKVFPIGKWFFLFPPLYCLNWWNSLMKIEINSNSFILLTVPRRQFPINDRWTRLKISVKLVGSLYEVDG